MNRKGQYNFLTLGAIGAGSFFLVAVVMALIFANIGANSQVNAVYGGAATAINGEPITLLNGTAVAVSQTLVNPGSWVLYNASNLLGNTNFTFNNATGTVTLLATHTLGSGYNNSAVSVNYTYDNTANVVSGDLNATAIVGDAKVANNTLSSLGTIFVYVVFLVAVLGILALVGYGAYRLRR